MAVLSGLEVPELAQAIAHGELARLTRIHGVGKKTAERLVLELKDKLSALTVPEMDRGEPAPATHTPKDDLLSALVHLGYSHGEAERGAERALREDGAGRFEDLLRHALRVLAAR